MGSVIQMKKHLLSTNLFKVLYIARDKMVIPAVRGHML